MCAQFRAQVFTIAFHASPGGACSAARTKVSWISRKTSLSDFHEQVVLAPKMVVKATVRQ
jgi:hypothetical protein